METILLVDDEGEVLAMVREMLEGKGYRILEAGGAEEALRIAAGHAEPIHLLLTDVVMPGMSGHDLAQRLGRERPEMKVLYMSAFSLTPAHQLILETNPGLEPGSLIIPKPFTIEQLTGKVREVLDYRPPPPSPFARRPGQAQSEGRPDPWWHEGRS